MATHLHRLCVFLFVLLSACRVEPPPSQNTFELVGLHEPLGCADCHDPNRPLGPLPTDCASCHLQDAPPAHFQPACEACHDEFGWPVQIDHGFFPLADSHQVACQRCHTDGTLDGLVPTCGACHEGERPDVHFPGQDCASCHTPTRWDDAAVDHAFFPLDGGHAIDCASCHTAAPDFTGLDVACSTCHAPDRPTAGHYVGLECDSCHQRTVWTALPDHSFFALTGNHARSCDSCHTAIPDFTGVDGGCATCHEADRPEPTHFTGQDCAVCHTVAGWEGAVDHSSFPLDQAHALDCATCHTAIPDFTGLDTACSTCHGPDRPTPAHYLPFECDSCHQRTVWTALPDHSFLPLTGNHARSCDTCHTAIPVFTGLDGGCATCHEADRPEPTHFTGQDCAVCHDSTAWAGAVDHTFFPLVQSHALDCASCHTAIPDFTGLSMACSSCHGPDRPTPAHYLPYECDSCHQRTVWTALPDHSFFALTGDHDRTCDACHTAIPSFTGLDGEACSTCHLADRPNPAHFTGRDCSVCHQVSGWPLNVDHSFFALTGDHDRSCETCHTAIPDFTGLGGGCATCHEGDRPAPSHFAGQDCADCHDTTGWDEVVEHGFFPLTDSHAVGCVSCHTAIPIYIGLSQACSSCHLGDRPSPGHYAGFECNACHTITVWSQTPDHSFFALAGNHDQPCTSCHTAIPSFTGLNPSCAGCHLGDRPSPTHFTGQDCSLCHQTSGWPIQVDHSFFPLQDAHTQPCEACHTAIPIYTGLSQACSSCHQADRPAVHDPGECSDCHSPTTWALDHDFFPLQANHAVACSSCHLQAPASYAGLSPDCAACHEADRPTGCHFTEQVCASCHTIDSSWLQSAPNSINHNALFGIAVPHREAARQCVDCHETPDSYCDYDCLDCHGNAPNQHSDVNGFQNVSTSCFDCHYD